MKEAAGVRTQTLEPETLDHSPLDISTPDSTLSTEGLKTETRKEVRVFKSPFPYAVIDNFLDGEVAHQIEQEFPVPEEIPFYQNTPKRFLSWHMNPLDPAMNDRPLLKSLFSYLQQPDIKKQIAEIFNIKTELLCDPYYVGSGLLVAKDGGIHKIHRDRNYHPDSHFYRRLVVLVYFNKDWQPEYGGALNLWDEQIKNCVTVEPLLNRCVIFENGRHAFHGISDIHLPEGMTRKAVNFYYYTAEPPESERDMYIHNTEFFPGPGEKFQYWIDSIATRFPLYLMRALAPKCVPVTRALQQRGLARLWLSSKGALARIYSYEKYQRLMTSTEWKLLDKPKKEVLEAWNTYNS